eukprot:988801-Pyramimonas_sp.AAC.1
MPYGPLLRQRGESIVSYTSRRKRWWKLVSKLDPEILMSGDLLGSLFLDHASLSPSESPMELTSTGHVTAFDKIKDVLILQHGRIHIHQKCKGESGMAPALRRGRSPDPATRTGAWARA